MQPVQIFAAFRCDDDHVLDPNPAKRLAVEARFHRQRIAANKCWALVVEKWRLVNIEANSVARSVSH